MHCRNGRCHAARFMTSYVDELKRRIENEWAHLNDTVHWTCGRWHGATVYVLVFLLEADISSIWRKDDVTYYTFYGLWDDKCQSCLWLFSDSLKCTCKYCLDGSVYFIFPKVVLAHILGEVDNLCTVLLSVYFRTCLRTLIEIGSYWTDTEQKQLARFCTHSVVNFCGILCAFKKTFPNTVSCGLSVTTRLWISCVLIKYVRNIIRCRFVSPVC